MINSGGFFVLIVFGAISVFLGHYFFFIALEALLFVQVESNESVICYS